MRIVHVINSLATGGAERLVVDLCAEARRLGHQAEIIVLEDRPGVPANSARASNIPVHVLAGSRFSITIAGRLRKAVAGYDVVHAHLFPALYWVATVARKPLVFTEHSTSNRRVKRWYWALAERFAYRRFSALVAISAGVGEALGSYLDHLKVDREKVWVVPNGVRREFFKGARPSRIGDSAIKLVSVASLRPVKNLELAIRAVASSGGVTLDIAGDGPMKAELSDLIVRLGVKDRVRLMGSVAKVEDLIPGYDAFLCTSRYEGFGLAVAEAMACGLPVIGPKIPGLSDVVIDGETGILYNDSEVQAVAEAIDRLRDNDLYSQMSESARQRALNFSLENCAQAYLKVYEHVAALHRDLDAGEANA